MLQPLAASAAPASSGARPAEAPLSGAAVGHLQGPQRLTHLFEALAKLDDGHAHDDVRILQYGDSHTASDLGVAVFRRALQARFGDGGRGFVSVGKPWKTYAQDGVRGGMTKEFEPYEGQVPQGPDLRGARRRATACSASASRVEGRSARVDRRRGPLVAHRDRLRAGPARRQLRRLRRRRARRARGDAREHGGSAASSRSTSPTRPHQVEVRTVGDGEVRVFGMTLDRPEAGVVVDALGINGAQIFTPLRWNEEHFAEQLRHARPTSSSWRTARTRRSSPASPTREYERKAGRRARAHRARGADASCLLLGPPDLARRHEGRRTTGSTLAARLGDRRDPAARRRGGRLRASTIRWRRWAARVASPPWADASPSPARQGDRVHLTRDRLRAGRDRPSRPTSCTPTTSGAPSAGSPPTSAPRTWGTRCQCRDREQR